MRINATNGFWKEATPHECGMSRRRSGWESQLTIAWEICATRKRESGHPSSYESRKVGWTGMGCGIVLFLSLLLRDWATLNKSPNTHILEACWRSYFQHAEDIFACMNASAPEADGLQWIYAPSPAAKATCTNSIKPHWLSAEADCRVLLCPLPSSQLQGGNQGGYSKPTDFTSHLFF